MEKLYSYEDILLFRQIGTEEALKFKEKIMEKKSKSIFSFNKKAASKFFTKIPEKSVR